MAVKDYSTDPDANVQISGINIAEGCPPSGINNAIRQLMADVKEEQETHEAQAAAQAAKDTAQDTAIAEAENSVTLLEETLRALIAEEVAKYLPLTGGVMTGNIAFAQQEVLLYKNTLDGRLIIRGGSSGFADGASLYLYGNTHPDLPGHCILYAHDGERFLSLDLRPEGTGYLGNHRIIPLVEAWTSGANWYRKWEDGWIEQGGYATITNTTLSLNTQHKDGNYVVSLALHSGANPLTAVSYHSKTTSNFYLASRKFSGDDTFVGVAWSTKGY